MNRAPVVSVIIPHYDDLKRLDLCLASVAKQNLPSEVFEVIVSDNGSPDGETAIADLVGERARLVFAKERGAGPARNYGARVARGTVLAFLDCDCRAEPSWLAEGLRALSQVDFAGGRVKVLVEDETNLTAAEAFEREFAFDIKTYVEKKRFAVTANLFCPRVIFDRIGPFGVGVSEDKDWCLRAGKAGFRIGYAPEAIVGHPARRTWRELEMKWRRINRESFALYSAQPLGKLWWSLRTLALPVSALVHSPRVVLSPKLMGSRQRILAVQMLWRLRFWRLGDALRLLLHGER